MSPPLARTNEEAHLYMQMHPCACGATDFGASSSVALVEDAWVCRYEGRCAGCGRPRGFEFRQPDEIAMAEGDAWAPGGQPSQLIDAGEWLAVADTYGGHPADLTGLSEVEVQQLARDLRAAAAAVDEVLKFLPAGAPAVPETAFWSYRGQRVWRSEPGRFGRIRLEAAREAYRRLAAQLPAGGVPAGDGKGEQA
ncbi:MAG: hypothetical protein J2P15_23705 [Micromonosporaceae bacterium]|nr:hypothetical protein [Micromonosporaceae bacterium]